MFCIAALCFWFFFSFTWEDVFGKGYKQWRWPCAYQYQSCCVNRFGSSLFWTIVRLVAVYKVICSRYIILMEFKGTLIGEQWVQFYNYEYLSIHAFKFHFITEMFVEQRNECSYNFPKFSARIFGSQDLGCRQIKLLRGNLCLGELMRWIGIYVDLLISNDSLRLTKSHQLPLKNTECSLSDCPYRLCRPCSFVT